MLNHPVDSDQAAATAMANPEPTYNAHLLKKHSHSATIRATQSNCRTPIHKTRRVSLPPIVPSQHYITPPRSTNSSHTQSQSPSNSGSQSQSPSQSPIDEATLEVAHILPSLKDLFPKQYFNRPSPILKVPRIDSPDAMQRIASQNISTVINAAEYLENSRGECRHCALGRARERQLGYTSDSFKLEHMETLMDLAEDNKLGQYYLGSMGLYKTDGTPQYGYCIKGLEAHGTRTVIQTIGDYEAGTYICEYYNPNSGQCRDKKRCLIHRPDHKLFGYSPCGCVLSIPKSQLCSGVKLNPGRQAIDIRH